MFFARKRNHKPQTEEKPDRVRSETNQGRHSARALGIDRDTIASILRTLGEFALPTDSIPRDEFAERCEALATNLLTGRGDSHRSSDEGHGGVHREIIQTVRSQRQVESSEYSRHRESANIIVGDLVAGLRRSLESRQGYDHEIVSLLGEMEAAVKEGDLTKIRAVSGRAASLIKSVIIANQKEGQTLLENLTGQLTRMRKELDEARDQMQTDPLTLINNRRAFDDGFGKAVELAQATADDLALLMIDLDHFKGINDEYGHQEGDRVLRSVASQLVRCFPRRDDLVARYGGEEFAIVCSHTGAKDAGMLAERIRGSIEGMRIGTMEQVIKTTISVGYGVMRQGEGAEAFLRRCDEALYRAKKAGRNRTMTAD